MYKINKDNLAIVFVATNLTILVYIIYHRGFPI